MHLIEDHVLSVVAARVARDEFANAADHDLVDIAPDPDVTVAAGNQHRIIVGPVAHQCLGADASGGLVAGIEWRRQRSDIAARFRARRPDRLGLTTHDIRLTPGALLFKIGGKASQVANRGIGTMKVWRE